MVVAVLIGKETSSGFPGKNVYPVCGRPLMAYPLKSALEAKSVDRVYVSTDSPRMKAIAQEYGAEVIDRPADLCTTTALSEDVFIHARDWVQQRLPPGDSLDLLVLLMANAPMVTADIIDAGVHTLLADPTMDSAVSVSCYNMWGPHRARRIGVNGLLEPFISTEALPRGHAVTSDRNSDEDAWFADMGVSIIRPRNLDDIPGGLPPQRWMGRRIHPLRQAGGCDVDFPWQMAVVEWWLRERGFSDTAASFTSGTARP